MANEGGGRVSNVTIPDVAIHVRKGDLPRYVNQTYAQLIRALYPRSVHLFSENAHDADAVYKQVLQANVPARKIHFMHSMSTVSSWLAMAHARALVAHTSSFSVSASIVADHFVFVGEEQPAAGRYDDNRLYCSLGPWWYSTSYGSTACVDTTRHRHSTQTQAAQSPYHNLTTT